MLVLWHMKTNKGIAPIIIIVAIVIAAGAGYFIYQKESSSNEIQFLEWLVPKAQKVDDAIDNAEVEAEKILEQKGLPSGEVVTLSTVQAGIDSGKEAACELKRSSSSADYYYFSDGRVRREQYALNAVAVTVYADGYYYKWFEDNNGVYNGKGVDDFSEAEARMEKERTGISFDLSNLNAFLETSLSEARCVETTVSDSALIAPQE